MSGSALLVKKRFASLSSHDDLTAFVQQLGFAAAVFDNNQLIAGNDALVEMFAGDCDVLGENRKIKQIVSEVLYIADALSFDLQHDLHTYRCLASPVRGIENAVLVVFEDISREAENDKNNALLYRLSLLLSSGEHGLKERLQMAIDQILFELHVFDCSILLFDRQDGLLRIAAWGKSDHMSSMNGKGTFRIGEGIAGHVAEMRTPLVVADIMADERFARHEADGHPLSLLCTPLIVHNELMGVMCVSRKIGRGFSDREVQLFTIIANRLAALIQSDRNKCNELAANKLSHLLSSARNVFEQRSEILSLVGSIFAVDQVSFVQCVHAYKSLSISQFESGLTSKQEAFLKELLFTPKFARHLNQKKWFVLTSKTVGERASELKSLHLANTAIVPIIIRNHCEFFIVLRCRNWERTFGQDEATMGAAIGSQLAIAIENTLYHEEVLDERKRLQQIQDTLHDGLILYGPDKKVVTYNTAAKRLLGIKRSIHNLPWEDVLSKKANYYCTHILNRFFDPEVFLRLAVEEGKISTGLATLSGRPARTLEVTVSPVYDRQNQISGILSHFRDITPIHDLQTKMATRLKQLTNLFKISSVTGFNVQQLVRRILELVTRLLSVRASELILIDQDTHELYRVESAGDKALLERLGTSAHRKIKRTIQTKKSQMGNIHLEGGGSVQVLVVPVMGHRESCIGVMVVADKSNGQSFTKDDTHLAAIVVARIASKLDTAWLLNQVEEDREKLAAIIDQSVDGILVTDAEENIQIWNGALEKMTGLKAEKVRGVKVKVLRSQFTDIESFGSEGFSEVKFTHPHTGTTIWLGVAYAPIKADGTITGYVAILRDISRQKELEQAKNEFVSTASHELRSPITAIVGYLSMLRRGDAGKIIQPQQAFFVDKAYHNAKRMVSLIEDLLTTTRMETGQGRYQSEPVDILASIESILTDLRFRAEEKHIAITVNKAAYHTVIADKDGLHQVFTNIITNALKYTPNNGHIAIDFISKEEDGKRILVTSVKDSGVGIGKADQSKVFEKFSRIDNPLSISAGGTGLGLYITRMIVEQLGGKIWLNSEKGKGSTFYVSLPTPPRHGKERNI